MTETQLRLNAVKERALNEQPQTLEDLLAAADAPLADLIEAAHEVTAAKASSVFNFCAIVNAKSGRCSEDCHWCAQSKHYQGACSVYPLLDAKKVIDGALAAEKSGATRYSLVTSGRKLSPREVREAAEVVRELRRVTSLEICVSAGLLTEKEFKLLAQAGVSRCHCNLEASENFFPFVCSSHKFADKIKTIEAARKAGLEVCSGGIIGMGESRVNRIELALALQKLKVPSIPINILEPIAGTPLGDMTRLSEEEIVRTVALFRLANPCAYLRFAGGRRRLSEVCVKQCLRAGINSAIAGDMLTTQGTSVESDRKAARDCGYRMEQDEGLDFDRKHIWHPYAGTLHPPRLEKVVGAQGVTIELADGQKLIDGTSAWWCAAHGYRHPALVKALQNQAQALSHVMFGGLTHDPAIELSRRLMKIVPDGLQKIFYADSGSVAVEAAMKMAVQYQIACGNKERVNFATIKGGYHGDTWNAMSVCDPVAGMHSLFGSSLPIRHFVQAPKSTFDGTWDPSDIEPLKDLLEKQNDIAALILEPIFQGASAMRFYHPQFLKEASELCKEHGVLLIADEIATGFGRTGRRFACNWASVTPDIMTIGKALTGGMMTLSVVICTNAVADAISAVSPAAFMHGPTFMANALACSVACASLDLFESYDWQGAVHQIESGLREGLMPLKGTHGVKDVRVLGAIGVVELEHPVDSRWIQKEFVHEGVWVRPIGTLCYLMPPFVISKEELTKLTSAVRGVLKRQIERFER